MEKKTYVVELLPFEKTIEENPNLPGKGSAVYGVTNDRINEMEDTILEACDGKNSVYLAELLLEYVDTNKITFNEVLAMAWVFLNKEVQKRMKKGMAEILKRLLVEGLNDED